MWSFVNFALFSVIIVYLWEWIAFCQGTLTLEFGSVLRQEMKAIKQMDPDVQEVVRFAQQYAEKRFPWSVPRPHGTRSPKPALSHLRKRHLFYTYDGVMPLIFDDTVTDRTGHQYGISRLFPLGTIYSFIVSWQESLIRFCHNFTVSVYPKNSFNVYSHTFFLQNLNTTDQGKTTTKYLFPNVGDSYFKYIALGNSVEEFSYAPDVQENEYQDLHTLKQESVTAGKDKFDSGTSFQTHRSRFTTMTYNIWNMNSKSTKTGGYTVRMKRLKEVMQKADPDILALQEVRYEEAKGEELGPSQIHTLSEWFPQYQYIYQPGQMQMNTLSDGRTEEGVAIMSRYPIVSHNCIMLFINRSNSADTHQRVLLQADIYVPDIGVVHVFTTHLSLSHEAREKSVLQIWQHAKSLEGPVVVMGDLNAEPQEPAMMYLSGKKTFPREERSMLVDVWTMLHPDDLGYTFNALEKNLTKRIDYIFFKPWEDCCEVENCSIFDDGARGYKAASDHVPVMATFFKPFKSKYS